MDIYVEVYRVDREEGYLNSGELFNKKVFQKPFPLFGNVVIMLKQCVEILVLVLLTKNICRMIRLLSEILISEGKNMYKEDRLPQNAKEGILFLLIISIISVNTIAPIIMGMERGFSKENYLETLKIIP